MRERLLSTQKYLDGFYIIDDKAVVLEKKDSIEGDRSFEDLKELMKQI